MPTELKNEVVEADLNAIDLLDDVEYLREIEEP
jgi:hypothetical protein